MCAGLEGEGAGEEELVVELGAVVAAGGVLLDEVDGRGEDGLREGGGEGEAEGEAPGGVGGEVAHQLEVHGHLLVGNYHLSILLASDYKNYSLHTVTPIHTHHTHAPKSYIQKLTNNTQEGMRNIWAKLSRLHTNYIFLLGTNY